MSKTYQIKPDTFIKDFTKKYAPSMYDNIVALFDNMAHHDEIEAFVKTMLESEEFNTNFNDNNKLIIGYRRRSSKSDKVSYIDFIYKKDKQQHDSSSTKLIILADNIICASGTKDPYDHDATKIPKYQQIVFRKMLRQEVEGGDYVPKKYPDPEKQKAHEIHMNDMIDCMTRNTAILAIVFDLLSKELGKLAKIMLNKFKSDDKNSIEYKLYKQAAKGKASCAVNLFQQHTATDKDSSEEIKLKYPLNRVRISIDQKLGKVGFMTNNGFIYTILNGRKMALTNSETSIPAQVLVKNVLTDITYTTSPAFITRKSRMHMEITFEGSLSKFGLSIAPKIKKAVVYTHLSKEKEMPFRQDKIRQFVDQDEKEVNIEADFTQDTKKIKKSTKNEENEDDSYNDATDNDEDGNNNEDPAKDEKQEIDKSDDDVSNLLGEAVEDTTNRQKEDSKPPKETKQKSVRKTSKK